MTKNRIIWILYGLVCGFNILDAHQTNMLISRGAVELNPGVAHLIAAMGFWDAMGCAKGIPCLGLGLLLFIWLRKDVE